MTFCGGGGDDPRHSASKPLPRIPKETSDAGGAGRSRRRRGILHAQVAIVARLAFSGFSALLYQPLWTRLLGLSFGTTTEAIGTVLADKLERIPGPERSHFPRLAHYAAERALARRVPPAELVGHRDALLRHRDTEEGREFPLVNSLLERLSRALGDEHGARDFAAAARREPGGPGARALARASAACRCYPSSRSISSPSRCLIHGIAAARFRPRSAHAPIV